MKRNPLVMLAFTAAALALAAAADIPPQASRAQQPTLESVSLKVEKVAQRPKWAEEYSRWRVKFRWIPDGDERTIAWNPQHTLRCETYSDGSRAVLSVKGKNWSRTLISEVGKPGFSLPAWSTDGKVLAIELLSYASEDLVYIGDVFLIDFDAKGHATLCQIARDIRGTDLAWSYAGDKLVFADSDNICLFLRSSGKVVKVAGGYGPMTGYPTTSSNFAFSRDGDELALFYRTMPMEDIPENFVIHGLNVVH